MEIKKNNFLNSYTAIIPARKGSKGILNKNFIRCNDEPLIYWTIKAAIEAKIDRIIVSTDSDWIIEYAGKFEEIEIETRPAYLASDTTKTEEVISHLVKNNRIETSHLILLQPTSPCRNMNTIINAIKYFESEPPESTQALISVNEVDNKILKSFVLNREYRAVGIHNNELPFTRRQDLPPVFMSNGAIYICSTEKFKANSMLFQKNKTLLFKLSEEESIDIDRMEDIQKAELVLKYQFR